MDLSLMCCKRNFNYENECGRKSLLCNLLFPCFKSHGRIKNGHMFVFFCLIETTQSENLRFFLRNDSPADYKEINGNQTDDYIYDIRLQQPQYAQYIKIAKFELSIMTVCEVEVFQRGNVHVSYFYICLKYT